MCCCGFKIYRNSLYNIYTARIAIILNSVEVNFQCKQKTILATLYFNWMRCPLRSIQCPFISISELQSQFSIVSYFILAALHFFYVIIFLNRIARRKKTRYIYLWMDIEIDFPLYLPWLVNSQGKKRRKKLEHGMLNGIIYT